MNTTDFQLKLITILMSKQQPSEKASEANSPTMKAIMKENAKFWSDPITLKTDRRDN